MASSCFTCPSHMHSRLSVRDSSSGLESFPSAKYHARFLVLLNLNIAIVAAGHHGRLCRHVNRSTAYAVPQPYNNIYVMLSEAQVRSMLCRRSRGFGFIEYRDPRDADDAMYRMDGSNIGGRDITVRRFPKHRLQVVYTNLPGSVMQYQHRMAV